MGEEKLRQPGTAFQLREAISHLNLPSLFHTTYWRAVEASGWKEGSGSFMQPGLNSFSSQVSLQNMPSISTAAVWSFKSSLQVCLLLAEKLQDTRASVTYYTHSAKTMGKKLKSLSTHSYKLQ